MKDIYELQINGETNEMILAVCKQFKQLRFFSLKKKKKLRLQRKFEPMTSAILVRCSIN